eukprot:CAMPEP_0194493034 /NCGR_PEP_ID=MMETSP0253-20130528/11376_1 /TAXON_ID=2966 /ORGANISM="Noctiluca scintillans" /LENGTH=334 /DNA_ID=CAMNT_0039333971 /DNA_START=54 /DNA_END=1058 /DNA_ORIENTATION=+
MAFGSYGNTSGDAFGPYGADLGRPGPWAGNMGGFGGGMYGAGSGLGGFGGSGYGGPGLSGGCGNCGSSVGYYGSGVDGQPLNTMPGSYSGGFGGVGAPYGGMSSPYGGMSPYSTNLSPLGSIGGMSGMGPQPTGAFGPPPWGSGPPGNYSGMGGGFSGFGNSFLETMEGAMVEAVAEAMAEAMAEATAEHTAEAMAEAMEAPGMETLTDTDARSLASVKRSEARHLLTCEAWKSVARRPSLPFCMEWSPQAQAGPSNGDNPPTAKLFMSPLACLEFVMRLGLLAHRGLLVIHLLLVQTHEANEFNAPVRNPLARDWNMTVLHFFCANAHQPTQF